MQTLMRTLLVLISLVAAAAAGSTAQAHAFLDHASPLVGSTMQTAPHEVVLTFTQNLEPAFSTVEVTGANGGTSTRAKPRSAATPCGSG